MPSIAPPRQTSLALVTRRRSHATRDPRSGAPDHYHGVLPWGVLTFRERTRERGSRILVLNQLSYNRGGTTDDCISGRIRARAGVGQDQAGQDAGHGRADRRLGRPVSTARPTGDTRGPGTRHAGRAGWARSCPADPGATLVDGAAVGPNDGESPAHPRRTGAAAAWPVRGGGARHDPPGTMGGLAGRHCRGGPYAPDR